MVSKNKMLLYAKVSARRPRAGLTLTELLVVIAILVIVTSVLAPLIAPSLDGREVREAARQINAYMQQAQARAKELGRPVGVVIQRSSFIGNPSDPAALTDPNNLDLGYQLSLAEEPPPFKGFLPSDRAQVVGNVAYLQMGGSLATGQPDPAVFKMIQPNDLMRFNFRGPKYRVLHIGRLSDAQKMEFPRASIRVRFAPDGGLNRIVPASAVPFEVFRRPRQTSSTPLELPNGTALVMNLSGVGMDWFSTGTGSEVQQSGTAAMFARQKYIGLTEFARPLEADLIASDPTIVNNPLTIMFSPDGSVDRVYRVLPPAGLPTNQYFPPKRPQEKIFLFVGKDAIDTPTNFADTTNLWIAIDPINGLVTTAPHLPSSDIDPVTQPLRAIAVARQIAATGQSMGGQ